MPKTLKEDITPMRAYTIRTILAALVVGLLLPLVAIPARAQDQTWTPRPVTASVRGAGVNSPTPLYNAWIRAYKDVNPSAEIKYDSVGTAAAVAEFLEYKADFSGLDIALPTERIIHEAPDTLHIPMVIGGVVPVYNVPYLPENTTLRFSPTTLAGIFLGQIKRWNDPAIAADNPGVPLPSIPIKVLYRSDNARNSLTMSEYLSSVSPEWQSRIGSGTWVPWPTGLGYSSNSRVMNKLMWTPGAISYIDLVFALENKLPLPPIKNAAGNYVVPTTESLMAAAESTEMPADLRTPIANAKAENAYPLAGFTYILIRQQTYTDVEKAQALTDFLYWSLTEGQGATVRLGYAPLPENVRHRAIEQLRKVRVGGEQVFDGPVK